VGSSRGWRLAVVVAILVFGSGLDLAAQGPGFEEHIYAEVGGTPLWLDFLPAFGTAPEPRPLIIYIHGGAWQAGVRQSVPGPILGLRNDGFSIATIDYRLTSQAGSFGTEPVTWPAQRDDAKAAVRWLRAHASVLNVDPSAFTVWGDSAGGHLASSLALTNDTPGTTGDVGDWTAVSSAVRLGVNFYGPSDLLRLDLDVTIPPGSTIHHEALNSPESRLLGSDQTGISMGQILQNESVTTSPWDALVALAHDASPLFAVNPLQASPLFTGHGTLDTLIAFRQGEKLHEGLVDLGLDSTWRPVVGAGHGMPPAVYLEARDWILAQLAEPDFLRGDANADSAIDVADAITMLSFLFPAAPPAAPISCASALDANDDEALDISDSVFLLSWLFGANVTIADPASGCGADPTPGSLTCQQFAPCP